MIVKLAKLKGDKIYCPFCGKYLMRLENAARYDDYHFLKCNAAETNNWRCDGACCDLKCKECNDKCPSDTKWININVTPLGQLTERLNDIQCGCGGIRQTHQT